MTLAGTTKELLRYAALRYSRAARQHYHKAFDNSARHYMEDSILPAVSSSASTCVLFIGCRSYTFHYRHYFLQNRIEYWTSDIDPAARIWGERQKHLICDIRVLDQHSPSAMFDIVLLNGVFGYGVDDIPSMNLALRSIHRVMKPKGHLLIGWNKDRVADPEFLAAISAHFDRAISLPLPIRKEFEDHTHVYDLFRAVPNKP